MANREQLETALRNAHAAGDTAAARQLARALQAAPEPVTPSLADGFMGALSKAAQGLSLGFSDEGAGLVGGVRSLLGGGSFGEGYAQSRDQVRAFNQATSETMPKTAMAAELAGGLLTGGTGLARSATGLAGREFVERSAAVGAGLGTAQGAGQSEAEGLGLLNDAALGGVVGGAAGGAFSAAGQGLSNLAQRARQQTGQAIDGMRLTPGQAYDSNLLQRMEAGLESFPLTTGAFQGLRQQNQQAINAAAARAIGQSGNKVDDAVLARAHDELGAEFRALTQGKVIPADDQLRQALGQLNQDVAEGLFDRPIGQDAVKRLQEKIASGSFTDADYQRMSSQISQKMRSPSVEGDEKQILGGVKEALDNAVERALGPDELERFREVRGQWRNLVMLERGRTTDPVTGNVSGRTLANTLQRQDPAGFTRGGNQSELYNAARASRAFAPIVGDSGTATRIAPQMLMQGLAGAGGGSFLGMDPVMGAAAGLSLPALTRLYLRSRLPSGGLLARPAIPGGAAVSAPGLLQ